MAKKKSEVSLQDLLKVGAHFGHQSRRWNPLMKPYLHGARQGVHVFDLFQTKKLLEEACEFVKKLTIEGKSIIFVGTKRQAADVIREEAKRAEVHFVAQRWLGGTITNWDQIRKSIKKLIEMKAQREAGDFEKYTKKENVLISRKIAKLEKFLGGLVNLEKNPDALFIVDVKREVAAVKEANQKGIPIVAMVDSNCDPRLIDHIIPVNDDAIRSVKLIVSCIADSVIEGRQIREKKTVPAEGQSASGGKKAAKKPAVKKAPAKKKKK